MPRHPRLFMATNYTLWIWRCVIRLFLLFIVCVVRYQNRCFCCADGGKNGRKMALGPSGIGKAFRALSKFQKKVRPGRNYFWNFSYPALKFRIFVRYSRTFFLNFPEFELLKNTVTFRKLESQTNKKFPITRRGLPVKSESPRHGIRDRLRKLS